MSLIKNLVKEPKKEPEKKKEKSDEDGKQEEKVRPVIKSATDLQRLKLEKLMKDPQKPVVIAESRREKDYMASVPSFVRNVMGSSAGAGSGEFHVYRHLRRKEYARQKIIQAKSAREEADDTYRERIEQNRLIAEEKTAKKRAKRLKKKQRAKKPRGANQINKKQEEHATSESESDEKDDNDDAETEKQTVESPANSSDQQGDVNINEDDKNATTSPKEVTEDSQDSPNKSKIVEQQES